MPDTPGTATTRWKIRCAKGDFEAQRNDPRLHRIVTLARIVNSIRFTDSAAFDRHGQDTPAAARQRAGAFLYLTGILYEAFRFADRLGEHFRDVEAFQNGLAKMLKDPVVRSLRDGLLNTLRNEAVYHHDDLVYASGLGLIHADEYVFASGESKKASALYFDLADLAVLRYAIDSDEDSEVLLKHLSNQMVAVLQVATQFASQAEVLIRDTLNALPWTTVGRAS